MNNITALFTAARQYCLEHPYSTPIDEGIEWSYTFGGAMKASGEWFSYPDDRRKNEEVYDVFSELLTTIEHTVPDDFVSLDDLKAFLLTSSQDVHGHWRQGKRTSVNDVDRKNVASALIAFQEYVAAMTLEQLSAVRPLAFRHYMSPKERERLWYRLRRKWNVGTISSYWYPIEPRDYPPQPANVIAYQIAWFQQGIPLKTLHEIVARHGVREVWEFTERILPFMEDVVQDVTLMVPRAGVETYWSSEKRDWIMYASHEDSLTVGGTWLNEAIKRVWSAWEKYVYRGPFYSRPVIEE